MGGSANFEDPDYEDYKQGGLLPNPTPQAAVIAQPTPQEDTSTPAALPSTSEVAHTISSDTQGRSVQPRAGRVGRVAASEMMGDQDQRPEESHDEWMQRRQGAIDSGLIPKPRARYLDPQVEAGTRERELAAADTVATQMAQDQARQATLDAQERARQERAQRQAQVATWRDQGMVLQHTPEGDVRPQTREDGSPVFTPASHEPFQWKTEDGGDGKWYQDHRNDRGQMVRQNLEEAGQYHTDPVTGERYITLTGGSRQNIGVDENLLKTHQLRETQDALALEDAKNDALLAQRKQALKPLQEQLADARRVLKPDRAEAAWNAAQANYAPGGAMADPDLWNAAQKAHADFLAKWGPVQQTVEQAQAEIDALETKRTENTLKRAQTLADIRKFQRGRANRNGEEVSHEGTKARSEEPNVQGAPVDDGSVLPMFKDPATGKLSLQASPDAIGRAVRSGAVPPSQAASLIRQGVDQAAENLKAKPADNGVGAGQDFMVRWLAGTSSSVYNGMAGLARMAGATGVAKTLQEQAGMADYAKQTYANPAKADSASGVLGDTAAAITPLLASAGVAGAAVKAIGVATKLPQVAMMVAEKLGGVVGAGLQMAGEAGERSYQAHLAQNPDDAEGAQHAMNLAMLKTLPQLAMFEATGFMGGKVVKGLTKVFPSMEVPWLRATVSGLVNLAGNTAAVGGIRAMEGEKPFDQTKQEFAQNAVFALMHAHGEAQSAKYLPTARAIEDGSHPELILAKGLASDERQTPEIRAAAQKQVDAMEKGAKDFIKGMGAKAGGTQKDTYSGLLDLHASLADATRSEEGLAKFNEVRAKRGEKPLTQEQAVGMQQAASDQLHSVAQSVIGAAPAQADAALQALGSRFGAERILGEINTNPALARVALVVGSEGRGLVAPEALKAAGAALAGGDLTPKQLRARTDQVVGAHLMIEHLGQATTTGQMDPRAGALFERMGLVRRSLAADGTPQWRLTEDGIPFLQRGLREAVGREPGRFNVDIAKQGEPGAVAHALDEVGATREAEAVGDTPAPEQTFQVRVHHTDAAGGDAQEHWHTVKADEASKAEHVAAERLREKGRTVKETEAFPMEDRGPEQATKVNAETVRGLFNDTIKAYAADFRKLGINGVAHVPLTHPDMTGGGMALNGDRVHVNFARLAQGLSARMQAGESPRTLMEAMIHEEFTHALGVDALFHEAKRENPGASDEVAHEAAMARAKEISETAPASIVGAARHLYNDWDTLDHYQRGHELLRMVLSGKYRGTVTELIYKAANAVARYLVKSFHGLPEKSPLRKYAEATEARARELQIELGPRVEKPVDAGLKPEQISSNGRSAAEPKGTSAVQDRSAGTGSVVDEGGSRGVQQDGVVHGVRADAGREGVSGEFAGADRAELEREHARLQEQIDGGELGEADLNATIARQDAIAAEMKQRDAAAPEEVSHEGTKARSGEEVGAPKTGDVKFDRWQDAANAAQQGINTMPAEKALKHLDAAIEHLKNALDVPADERGFLVKQAEARRDGLVKDVELKRIAEEKGRQHFDVNGWNAPDFGDKGRGHVVGGDVLVKVAVDGKGELDPKYNVDGQGIFVNNGPGQAARIRLQNKAGMAPLIFDPVELEKKGIVVQKDGEGVINQNVPLAALSPQAKIRAIDVIFNELDYQGKPITESVVDAVAKNLGMDAELVRARINPKADTKTKLGNTILLKGEKVALGGEWKAKNPDGPEVFKGKWALAPLDGPKVNSQFGEGQDRMDRERTGAAQRLAIIQNFNADNVGLAWGESPSLSDGAPTMTAEGSVLAGNNRLMSLRDMRQTHPEKAQVYQDWVREKAAELGLDPKAFGDRPVALVRVVSGDLGGMDKSKFVQSNNTPGTERRSVAEVALQDRKVLANPAVTENLDPLEDGSFNKDFLHSFYNALGAPKDLRREDGSPDPEKIEKRAQAALLSHLLGSAPGSDRVLANLMDNMGKPGVRQAVAGLAKAGPALLHVEAINPAANILPEVGRAVAELLEYRRAKDSGEVRDVAEFKAQGNLFFSEENGDSALESKVLELLASAKSAKGVWEPFLNYAKAVEEYGSPNQDRLFPMKEPNVRDFLKAADPARRGISERLWDIAQSTPESDKPLSAAEVAKWSALHRKLMEVERENGGLNATQRAAMDKAERALGQGLMFGGELEPGVKRESAAEHHARWTDAPLFGGNVTEQHGLFDERGSSGVGRFEQDKRQGVLFAANPAEKPEFEKTAKGWEESLKEERRPAKTFLEAGRQAQAFVGRPVTNKDTGIPAEVSRGNLGKMLSASAALKSTSAADHALAIANVDHLYEVAVLDRSHPDKNQEPTIAGIHRFVAPLKTESGEVVAVKMTVKETSHPKQPNPLYTIETMEIEKPGLDAPQSGIERATEVNRNAPQPGFTPKIRALLNRVNPELGMGEKGLRAANPAQKGLDFGTRGLELFDRLPEKDRERVMELHPPVRPADLFSHEGTEARSEERNDSREGAKPQGAVGKLTAEQWKQDPRSKQLPKEVGFVGDFDRASHETPLDVARLGKLPWEQQSRIAEAFGWRIHKGNAAQELAGRKQLLDWGRKGNVMSRLEALPNDQMKSMAEAAGVPMGYGNRANRNRIVAAWIEATEQKFATWTTNAAWLKQAVEEMKAGLPLDKGMASTTGLFSFAHDQFGYETRGDQLIKGDGKRWTVNNRQLSKNELDAAVQSAVATRDDFVKKTEELRGEYADLLAKNGGKDIDRKQVELYSYAPQKIEQLRKEIEKAGADTSRDALTKSLEELEKDYATAKAAVGDSVERLGLRDADQLAFLGSGFFDRRKGLLGDMERNISKLRETVNAPADSQSEIIQPKPAAGQMDLFDQSMKAAAKAQAEEPAVTISSKPVDAKGGIQDFGEKFGGARKDQTPSLAVELTDKDIANKPLSEIWPKAEVDAIQDNQLAAVAHALRDAVPSKPRQGYKLARWVDTVKQVRGLMQHAQEKGFDEILRRMEEKGLSKFTNKIRLLSSIDRAQWGRIDEVENYPGAIRYVEGKSTPAPYAYARVDGRPVNAPNLTELVEAVSKVVSGAKPEAKMQFEVRGREGAWGINKKGDPLYRKLKTFTDSKAALEYARSNHADLVQAWEGVKERENVKERDLRRDDNRPRTGANHRNGRDISPEAFAKEFGFRGVEFGNWVAQGGNAKERQGMLNQAFDAFKDLADILKVPAQALSLNGELGIAFGSRGHGWASAHYEPGKIVINLTKTRGAGTLAHEFFHALDHYFQRARGEGASNRERSYITYQPETQYKENKTGFNLSAEHFQNLSKRPGFNPENWQKVEGVRPEVEEAFTELVKALDASPMNKRARLLDKGSSNGYWSRIIERAARSFENYTIFKMQQEGYHNDYLANIVGPEDFARDIGRYPYLIDAELKPVAEAFDNLIGTLKTKETEKGTALYAANPEVDKKQIEGYLDSRNVQGKYRAEATQALREIATAQEPQGVYSLWDWPGATGGSVKAGVAPIQRAGTPAGRDILSVEALKDPTGPIARQQLRTKGSFSSILPELFDPEKAKHWDVRGAILTGPEDAFKLLQCVRSPYVETVKVAVLGKNNDVVASTILNIGTMNESVANPRDMIRFLQNNSTTGEKGRLFLAHNHPSGDVTPSDADRRVTERLRNASQSLGFEVVDHVITNGESYYSFRHGGMDTGGTYSGVAGAKEMAAEPAALRDLRGRPVAMADWEQVPREALKVVDAPDNFRSLLETFKSDAPDSAHLLYLNTKMGLTGVERVPAAGVPDIANTFVRSALREGAFFVVAQVPGPSDVMSRAATAQRYAEVGAQTGVRVLDVFFEDGKSAAGVPQFLSAKQAGLLAEQPGEYPKEGKQNEHDRQSEGESRGRKTEEMAGAPEGGRGESANPAPTGGAAERRGGADAGGNDDRRGVNRQEALLQKAVDTLEAIPQRKPGQEAALNRARSELARVKKDFTEITSNVYSQDRGNTAIIRNGIRETPPERLSGRLGKADSGAGERVWGDADRGILERGLAGIQGGYERAFKNLGIVVEGDRAPNRNNPSRTPTLSADAYGNGEIRIGGNRRALLEAAYYETQGNREAAMRWLRDGYTEELSHAAWLVAQKRAWEANGGLRRGDDFKKYCEQRTREIGESVFKTRDMARAAGDEKTAQAIEQAIVRSYKLYDTGDASKSDAAVFAEIEKGGLWKMTTELVRQLVQIRRTSERATTETGWRVVFDKVSGWLKDTLGVLRDAAKDANEGKMGGQLQRALRQTEGVLDEVTKPGTFDVSQKGLRAAAVEPKKQVERLEELLKANREGKGRQAMAAGDGIAAPEVEARAKKDGITSAETRMAESLGMKKPEKTPQAATAEAQNAALAKELEALEPKADKLGGMKERARGFSDWMKKLWQENTQLPPDDPYKRSVNRYTAKLQASELEVVRMVHELVKRVPDALAREGITNWRVAQGDENKLRLWAELSVDPKAKAGYEAALRLTPDQIEIARTIDDYYKSKLALGQERGMLEHGVENYASQIWRDDKGKKIDMEGVPSAADYETDSKGNLLRDADGNFILKLGRKFNQAFAFANPRQFEDFFTGESQGFRPLTKDAASLLGIYGSEFNRTMALREFVQELTHVKAEDGRPLVGVGVSTVLRGVKEGEPLDANGAFHIERPENSLGYKNVNHPVFERWKYTTPMQAGEEAMELPGQGRSQMEFGNEGMGAGAEKGKTVAMLRSGNLMVHPDFEKRFNNMVGESGVRRWANSKGSAMAEVPKAVVRAIDWSNKEMKGLTFVGSPFHLIHLAKRAAGYQINPFTDLHPVDPENPLHRRAMLAGLMLSPDKNGIGRWMEGLGGGDARMADKIPLAKELAHYCFENYIPRLKMKSWTALTERMVEKFKPDIESGKVSVYQVENYAARIINNAYGHLNYAELGANPTVQHLKSLVLLAPDFTESTLRHLGDAARGINPGSKIGRESFKSIVVLAMGTMFVAKTLNKLIDGDWHMDHPFSVVVGNREYSVRSQVADIQHMYHDIRGYGMARLSPITKTLWQMGSQKNYRGESMGWTDQARDFIASWIPATLRSLPGMNQVSPTDAVKNLKWYEQFAASMGFKVARYSASKEMNAAADKFLQAKGRPSMSGAFQPSRYRAIKNALDDGDLEAAKAEYRSLVKGAMEEAKRKAKGGVEVRDPLAALQNGIYMSVFHPIVSDKALNAEFLRSLTPHQRELYIQSMKDRNQIWGRFQKISGSDKLPPIPSLPPPVTAAASPGAERPMQPMARRKVAGETAMV